MKADRAREFYSFLRCPHCGSKLKLLGNRTTGLTVVRSAKLLCSSCRSEYSISGYVPRLLPQKLSVVLGEIRAAWFNSQLKVSASEKAQALRWLSQQFGVPDLELSSYGSVLARVAVSALRACQRHHFDDKETREVVGILGAQLMSAGYKRYVADQMYASEKAASYEKYEDIILRVIVDRCLLENPAVIIELGSGVGRLLHQYGSCLSDDTEAAKPYRKYLRDMYTPDSLTNRENLGLVLGLDYEWKMIQMAKRWLFADRLIQLMTKSGKLVQVCGSTVHTPISFEDTPFQEAMKIVCILFQTLGNQVDRRLQIDMLQKAWKLASPNGLVFVSVFNRQAFDEEASAYYSSIEKSVGRAAYCHDGVFVSGKAVYSRWFNSEEVKDLFIAAGITTFETLDSNTLSNFPRYHQYLDVEKQEVYKRRAIISLASSSANLLADVKDLITRP